MTRLNLGCHQWPITGWVNIDLDPDYGEVVADCLHLPYEDNSVDEIFAGHLLEHTTRDENALSEWHRVLKPGGLITVIVPDLEKSLSLFQAGGMELAWLTQVLFGSTDRDEQNHHQLFTESILLNDMRPYFPDVVITPSFEHAVAQVSWQTIGQGHKSQIA